MLYVEWCSKPNRRAGAMVPVRDLPKLEATHDAGYRSVYSFDAAAAKEIAGTGTSKTLSKFEPHSTELFIDLDNGDTDVPRIVEFCKDTGTAAKLYTSGSKGIHVHIPVEHMQGANVPYSQLTWVEKIGITHDPSIYRVASLIALPGRMHPRTRNRKTETLSIGGSSVTIPEVQRPVKIDFTGFKPSEDAFGLALQELFVAASIPPRPGKRYTTLWHLAKCCHESNMGREVCYGLLREVNLRWPQPTAETEVERAVKDGYGT